MANYSRKLLTSITNIVILIGLINVGITHAQVEFFFEFGSRGRGAGEFESPGAIATDSRDNILVAEVFNNRVQVFDSFGAFLFEFRVGAARAIATDSRDNIIVADVGQEKAVGVFDSSGEFLFQFGSPDAGTGEVIRSGAVATDSRDNIIVGFSNERVHVFDSSGEFLFEVGAQGRGTAFGNAANIAVDSRDNIIVSEFDNNFVHVFDSSGAFLFEFGVGAGVSIGFGLATDSRDNIIVADFSNNIVHVFDPSGEFLFEFGSRGSGAGEFEGPAGIATDSRDNIIVADFRNSRVQVFGFAEVGATVSCPLSPPQDCPITVEINIDMINSPAPDELLGSFTGSLNWDPTLLKYTGDSGVLSGFTGVVNVDADNGMLTFNGANANGAGRVVDIFNVDFTVVGPVETTATIDLGFSALAAANTFADLLPELKVNNCSFTIIEPGLLGDTNSDDLVNSTDALIVLSFDIGRTISPALLDRINFGLVDANSDTLTNSTDALIILTFDAGFQVPFPVGEPFCPNSGTFTAESAFANNLMEAKKITATAVPDDRQEGDEQTLKVPVVIDLSEIDEKLGSFTATLTWDPQVLEFAGFIGGNSQGFEHPVVDSSEVDVGNLRFANAYADGAGGMVNVLNVIFEDVGQTGSTNNLPLSFSAMTAAKTFIDLLPYLNSVTGVEENREALEIPENYGLAQNFPNPFNPETEIRFHLPETGQVVLRIFNVLGEETRTLADGRYEAGYHVARWDGKDNNGLTVSSGIYFYQLQAGSFSQTKKMSLLR